MTDLTNFKEVSKEEFYGIVYSKKLNVHPDPQSGNLNTVHWKFLDYKKYGQIFGVSISNNNFQNDKYYINTLNHF